MKSINKFIHLKFLYIFFLILSLNIFFFSTTKVEGKPFEVKEIEVSRPFEINFDKNDVIDEGFKRGFKKLLSLIVNSSDKKKINRIKLNEIKGMVESFSFEEENFIDDIYNMKMSVSFNKKKVFRYLEEKNIFPSVPLKNKFFHLKFLYIFFIILSLNIFFFSTTKVEGKPFEVKEIEVSRPFEINFAKNDVIDEGFKRGFKKLLSLIVNSSDKKKINKIKLNEIKGMVESFSFEEENFIDDIYNMKMSVSFNKKKVFRYLEEKNIFPSIPLKNKFLFIPIVIDEKKKDLLIFDNNKIFEEWNKISEEYNLIEYILPTEDLEDLKIIKDNYELIEQYNFNEITNKYYLKDSIIALIFKNEKELRVLSRITVKDSVILKNQTFSNINLRNIDHIHNLIKNLKLIYEDYWKNSNQINTSIKLALNIKLNNSNKNKIDNFEKNLNQTDLIYDFFITKFDSKFTFYQIIFNGTPDNFLKIMNTFDYDFDTQNKIWILK